MNDFKKFLKTLTTHPGVYQMLSQDGEILYVGKAKNLKKRVSSYFRRDTKDAKTATLVQQIHDIQVIVTASENEALLLENNLIKKFKPHYNILFRDDKSYPYLFLSNHPDYPRLDFYRGAQHQDGHYFGPYPSTLAVREALHLIQRIFKLRQCRDSFFRHRSRPCLQYYIKRCSAPCVGLIDPESYQQSVRQATLFLNGKSQEVIQASITKMDAASEKLDFEHAAYYRDQIAQLRQVQERQYVFGMGKSDVDVIAILPGCIQLLSIHAGQLLGSKVFFQNLPEHMSLEEALASFLSQHYVEQGGREVLVNLKPADKSWLEEALSLKITQPIRGDKTRWVEMAVNNAKQALAAHNARNMQQHQRMEVLQEALGLEMIPQRLECIDISHTMGEATVGSCVVFDIDGPVKSDYRHFNITDITPGDDYAAMRQVLLRRYTRLKNADGKLPDILFIDGGKGQLKQAEEVFEELQISGVMLIGVAKGEGRKPGLETLYMRKGVRSTFDTSFSKLVSNVDLTPEAFLLVQQIRDEAHRFAITGHRQRRAKARKESPLESIPGVGAKRRRELLRQLGGLSEVKRASIEELAKVPGISLDLARRIYEALHV